MSNILLITDVARLRKIFGRLSEDRNIRLRVVNNLEKGGEEITIEKPDVVFVQTHLSGLSADILIMHLKKQLGRRRSRFVLLASPGQVNDAILKPYQGWLDTSAEDSQLLAELQTLLVALLSRPKKKAEPATAEPIPSIEFKPLPVSMAESAALLGSPPVPVDVPVQQVTAELQPPPAPQPSAELSLEEQGITYSPRRRLSVYSEFNSSFDNAVNSTPEPESLEEAIPSPAHGWDAEEIDTVKSKPARTKRGAFLLWLAPVIVAVVVLTYLQQQRSAPKPDQGDGKTAPRAQMSAAPNVQPAKTMPAATVMPPAAARDQESLSDKAVLNAIAENRASKNSPAVPSAEARPTKLPAFIPRSGFDKTFSAANQGWELYKGQVTEFKVLREGGAIKAIQVIDRGGQGVPESFMKGVLSQVAKNPVLSSESSEKKEGYEIQRGRVAANIRAVYYRDERGGKLRAFVLTWQ
jgi:DNA-binding response OmpR family regulator